MLTNLQKSQNRRTRVSAKRKSIKTEGLHRRYPLNLRAMGKFVRRSQAPTLEERRLRQELDELKIAFRQLTRTVALLAVPPATANSNVSRTISGDRPIWNRHQPLPRRMTPYMTSPVPGENREGEERHCRHVGGPSGQMSPHLRARRTPNRSHLAPHPFMSPITTSTVRPSPVASTTTNRNSPPVFPDQAASEQHTVPGVPGPRPRRAPNNAYVPGHPNHTRSYIGPRISQTTRRNQARHLAARAIIDHVYMAEVNPTTSGPSLKVALQAPSRFRSTLKSDSTFSVIWDSGASITISPNKEDFDGPILKPSTITQLKGIAKGLQIEGQGHFKWSFHDAYGNLRTLKLPAYYVPKVRVRLLSTTSLL